MRDFVRGVALFLALFVAAGLVLAVAAGKRGADVWILDARALPQPAAVIVLAVTAAALFVYSLQLVQKRTVRGVVAVTVAFAGVIALVNAAGYYLLLAHGAIGSYFPMPFSALVASVCGVAAVDVASCAPSATSVKKVVAGFTMAALAFPLLQVVCLGSTDYRHSADLVVVFGAKANADGTPSSALEDRVRTACELYRRGEARRLLFSGGPGAGAIDEPHAMQALAEQLGVPRSNILLDSAGVNTEATVRNTAAVLHGQRVRLLAVSHFYHLPRIKLAFENAGIPVETVPCHISAPSHLLYNVPREAIAFWSYYLREI